MGSISYRRFIVTYTDSQKDGEIITALSSNDRFPLQLINDADYV